MKLIIHMSVLCMCVCTRVYMYVCIYGCVYLCTYVRMKALCFMFYIRENLFMYAFMYESICP